MGWLWYLNNLDMQRLYMNGDFRNGNTRALCQASTGSMTMAIKARRALAQRNISVNVKKLSAASSRKGCIYGIEYPCELSGNVFSLLREHGVDAESFYK